MRRGQERHRRVLRSDGQNGRPHIDIGYHGLVRDQRHFRFAGGAAGQVKDRGVGGLHFSAQPRQQIGIARQRFAARGAQSAQRERAFGFAGKQNPMRPRSFTQGGRFASRGRFTKRGQSLGSSTNTARAPVAAMVRTRSLGG
jgi:hypothetical protein